MLPLPELAARLDALLGVLDQSEDDRAAAIAAVAPQHRAGAVNLVHYTALRQRDIRELQNDLLDLGATSLATTEADVRAKVMAARNVLGALLGEPVQDLDRINAALDRGDALLEEHAEQVLGRIEPRCATRIMVTLPGEAAADPGLVADCVGAGMDLARINCAHDDEAAWAAMAGHVRAAARRAGRSVLVSMDVPGPKLRTGPIAPGPAVGRARVTRDEAGAVVAPARLWLTDAAAPAPPPPAPAPAKRPVLAVGVPGPWLADRVVGDRIDVPDVRGRKRAFTVVELGAGGVLAEGRRNTWIRNGAALRCGGWEAVASGIAPVPRRLSLQPGDTLVLTADLAPVDPPQPGGSATIGCTLAEALDAVRPGDAVLLDDGAIRARVQQVRDGAAQLTVEHTKPGGQRLGAEKGINLPDTVLALPALTEQDEALLPFIAEHADLVAVSFVRTGEDVRHILDALQRAGAGDLGLVLKIETRQGFENLPSILLEGMRHDRLAVMIARGDLAVEVGFERLSEVPRQILSLCEAAHVPVIWATQVLESLAKTGQPSRAEITDAAAGQRAECVMLNKGPHIVEAITALDAILDRVAQVQRKSRTLMRRIHSWDGQ